MDSAMLERAADAALGELDRLRVAYAHGLERDVEPPSLAIQLALRDALDKWRGRCRLDSRTFGEAVCAIHDADDAPPGPCSYASEGSE